MGEPRFDMPWPFTGPSIQEKIQAAAEEKGNEIRDKVEQQMCMQMQINKSLSIAQARDSLQWFGGLYTTLVGAVTVAKVAGKPVPAPVLIPIVLGGFGLANIADMAYGTKLVRVTREVEHILENESHRLVAPRQIAFYEKFKEEDRRAYPDTTAVGTHWPSFHPWNTANASDGLYSPWK